MRAVGDTRDLQRSRLRCQFETRVGFGEDYSQEIPILYDDLFLLQRVDTGEVYRQLFWYWKMGVEKREKTQREMGVGRMGVG